MEDFSPRDMEKGDGEGGGCAGAEVEPPLPKGGTDPWGLVAYGEAAVDQGRGGS
jgi:hypothetical protein